MFNFLRKNKKAKEEKPPHPLFNRIDKLVERRKEIDKVLLPIENGCPCTSSGPSLFKIESMVHEKIWINRGLELMLAENEWDYNPSKVRVLNAMAWNDRLAQNGIATEEERRKYVIKILNGDKLVEDDTDGS